MLARSLAILVLVALAALGSSPPQKTEKPAAADPAAIAAGAKLYGQFCQTCHGKSGLGDGPGAANLNPKPRKLTDPKALKSKTDDDLFKVISKGGPALGLSPVMTGWSSVLKEPQIRQLVAFVRSLPDSAAKAGAAKGKQP